MPVPVAAGEAAGCMCTLTIYYTLVPVVALFTCLIICTFQLVFSAGTVFFSYDKSAETMFRLVFFSEANGALVGKLGDNNHCLYSKL